jgi:hypothetical protein
MEQIIVALIGLVGSIVVVLIQRNRRHERNEHGRVMTLLGEIKEDISDLDSDIKIVEEKLDTHIRDHAIRMFDHAHER